MSEDFFMIGVIKWILQRLNTDNCNVCYQGWDQGVIGMMKGSRRLIGIPSTLAYGEKVGCQ